jgi:hypothetical protein
VRRTSFGQVLDRLIDDGPRRSAGPGIMTTPLGGTPFTNRRSYSAAFFGTRPVRRRHRLSARERAALDVLRTAGVVDLEDDFLLTELKSAFRRLARSVHPDVHPRAGEAERQHLAAQFRNIQQAYEILADGGRS